MRNRLSQVACAVLVFASGCGTVSNFRDEHHPAGDPPHAKVFGGVREDVRSLTDTAWGEFPFGAILMADLPLSLVGDVFTLPWAIKATRVRRAWSAWEPVIVP